MNYSETLNWMFAQLPMYQKIGASAHTKDLKNTIKLLAYLNNPEANFKSVHVGGTNGKGSTSSLLASVLQVAGYKVGLYTSPHLKDFRERIRINGEMIAENDVVAFIDQHKSFLESNQLSFFEMTVGLAFEYFADQKVDVAIIEVGLGGRLDSTNVITPLISVITNIGWDHMNMLGNTLPEIAAEKAGIIKPHVPVVIGEYTAETKPVFLAKADSVAAPIWFASEMNLPEIESALQGDYQLHNKKTALTALNCLKSYFTITEQNIKNGFLQVLNNTQFAGRWQVLGNKPFTVADTAHNKEGLTIVMQQVLKQNFDLLHFVFGVVNDKDLSAIIHLLPKQAMYYIAKPNVPRGLPVEELAEVMQHHGFNYLACNSIPEAYERAKLEAKPNDMIYIGGSTFVVAEVL
ncbi:bifunctional folylpolyglutamate synthase/dihydrofolate synthase [Flavobacterium agricola]|uniref:Dihydrofolate synthase/folylpolyglutamate synthase n=1 Tax=Flavobacterium agricola TaxID=2870839 RepID=A0ABY6LZ10_9FLAO|nr:folylpolyglutamate synthase/dihydrofolate synthase family protein [Flavobacterium agricola]UYW01469.1 bifunctional folylpolyglutamate synthase/dihydrofolate synthase [Flavobacterium agricola]